MNEDLHERIPKEKRASWSRRRFIKVMLGAGVGAGVEVLLGGVPGFSLREAKAQDDESQENYPEDIIPREELESRYHIQIFDLPKSRYPGNFVELNFRRAVEEEPLFGQLEQGRKKLTIFLVDHYLLDPDYFNPEQRKYLDRYPTVVGFLERSTARNLEQIKREIGEDRERKLEDYSRELEEISNREQNEEISFDEAEVQRQILDYRFRMYLVDEPDDELVMTSGGGVLGSSQSLGTTDDGVPEVFVFVAVREAPFITFQSGDYSKFVSSLITSIHEFSTTPKVSDSYPNVQSMNVGESSSDYPIRRLTGGLILRHELEHAGGSPIEKETDEAVIVDIREAQRRYAEGDDSLYWVVFDTPEGRVITERPSSYVAS